MTDYKTIRGKKIKTFATDLDNDQAEGQIFYSSTDNQFKTAVVSAAWSSSGPLIAAVRMHSGAGTQTAGLSFGGLLPGGVTNNTEEYNGNGWSSSGDLGTSRYELAGCGTQTAGLGFGGNAPPGILGVTEEYNGSTWSEQNDLGTARYE